MSVTSAVQLATDLDADAARIITLDIRDSAEGLLALVVEAYNGRVWIALGYESWDAWKQGELANIELPRDAIPALRSEGLSTRAIATVTGVDHSTVVRGGANAPPPRVTGADGKSYPAKHSNAGSSPTWRGTFSCSSCPKTFDHRVRHCPTCDRHWPSNQDCPICSADPGLAESRQQSRKQEEERRDAQALLNRIIDLTVPRASVNGWLDAWATRLGPSPHSLIDQTRAAGEALIRLSERMTSDL